AAWRRRPGRRHRGSHGTSRTGPARAGARRHRRRPAAAGTRIRRPPAGPRCPRAGGPARCLPGAPAGRRQPSPGRSIRARRRRPRPASRTGPRAVRRAWRPGRARGWPRRPPGEWAVATCRAGVWRDAKCINPAATAPWPAVRGRLTGARGAAYRGFHGTHARRQRPPPRPRRADRGTGRPLPAPGRREPQPAPATGAADGRARAIVAEERAGAFPGRGDDRAAAVAGAAHVSTEPVEVRILDREYTVGVPAGERDSLQAAARLLDSRMREIRG